MGFWFTPRPYYKYHFWHRSKIVWCGIARDLATTEQQLKDRFGETGRIRQIGQRASAEAALEWEREQDRRGFPTRRQR